MRAWECALVHTERHTWLRARAYRHDVSVNEINEASMNASILSASCCALCARDDASAGLAYRLGSAGETSVDLVLEQLLLDADAFVVLRHSCSHIPQHIP